MSDSPIEQLPLDERLTMLYAAKSLLLEYMERPDREGNQEQLRRFWTWLSTEIDSTEKRLNPPKPIKRSHKPPSRQSIDRLATVVQRPQRHR